MAAATTKAAGASPEPPPPPIKSVIVIGAGAFFRRACSVCCGVCRHDDFDFTPPPAPPIHKPKGIGGLCVANALRQKGLTVTVLERSKELSRQRCVVGWFG